MADAQDSVSLGPQLGLDSGKRSFNRWPQGPELRGISFLLLFWKLVYKRLDIERRGSFLPGTIRTQEKMDEYCPLLAVLQA